MLSNSKYLTNRSQKVIGEDNKYSNSIDICSLPQSSPLSPLLFALYSYDISQCSNFCKRHMYADDKQLYIHAKFDSLNEAVAKLSDDLMHVNEWSMRHGLELNASKTQAIIFGSDNMIKNLEDTVVDEPILNGL
jgi:hypothetical protein